MKNIWNPWHGCKKKSEGCANCYMYYLDEMRAGKDGSNVYRVKGEFDYPIKKNKLGEYKVPSLSTLQVCLTSDFFLKEADEWREEAWNMIRIRKDVMFWLLTKRPERIMECLPSDWGNGWKNVWLNVTVENQKRANERIPILFTLPFVYKGLVAAPLLEELHLETYLQTGKIDVISVGGENYANARPCRYEWVKSLYDQAVNAHVNFHFFETGQNFIKDGKTYYIPKRKQQEQAKKSGLFHQERAICLEYDKESETKQLSLFDEQ